VIAARSDRNARSRNVLRSRLGNGSAVIRPD